MTGHVFRASSNVHCYLHFRDVKLSGSIVDQFNRVLQHASNIDVTHTTELLTHVYSTLVMLLRAFRAQKGNSPHSCVRYCSLLQSMHSSQFHHSMHLSPFHTAIPILCICPNSILLSPFYAFVPIPYCHVPFHAEHLEPRFVLGVVPHIAEVLQKHQLYLRMECKNRVTKQTYCIAGKFGGDLAGNILGGLTISLLVSKAWGISTWDRGMRVCPLCLSLPPPPPPPPPPARTSYSFLARAHKRGGGRACN